MSYLGKEIGKLGFGLMRLPMIDTEVDIEQTKTMVDMFLNAGFTYFDTAYGYINGKSEEAIKVALVDRYPRESFQLATKLPAWAGAKTEEEAKQMFFTSLERTGAGYFDYYLLHNLGDDRTATFDNFNIWQFALEQKEKGLIKHLGFSIHDTAEALDKILTEHPEMEFVQLQINYADWNESNVQSRLCAEVAKKHNKPIIIMEPVKGGLLATPPQQIEDLLKGYNSEASCSSWAIRFAASQDNLITVLSGMSNIEQMEDNLKTMTNFQPINEDEMTIIEKAQEILASIESIPCTNCKYCVKDCPMQIVIPGIFQSMNRYYLFNNLTASKSNYAFQTRNGGKASTCIGCGSCEMACPQHIQIIDKLQEIANTLE